MKPNISTLERAFQLAASGLFSTVAQIKLRLMHEGYKQEQIQGPALAKQLRVTMSKARVSPSK
jgi:hypothetical protein